MRRKRQRLRDQATNGWYLYHAARLQHTSTATQWENDNLGNIDTFIMDAPTDYVTCQDQHVCLNKLNGTQGGVKLRETNMLHYLCLHEPTGWVEDVRQLAPDVDVTNFKTCVKLGICVWKHKRPRGVSRRCWAWHYTTSLSLWSTSSCSFGRTTNSLPAALIQPQPTPKAGIATAGTHGRRSALNSWKGNLVIG